jgi:Terpene cyclase DEP1
MERPGQCCIDFAHPASQPTVLPDRRVHRCSHIAAAALIGTWSHLGPYLHSFTDFFITFFRDTKVTPASRVATVDVLMLGVSVAILMVTEARKHNARFVWAYIADFSGVTCRTPAHQACVSTTRQTEPESRGGVPSDLSADSTAIKPTAPQLISGHSEIHLTYFAYRNTSCRSVIESGWRGRQSAHLSSRRCGACDSCVILERMNRTSKIGSW